MSRERMVTRTINSIEVKAICMDISTMETSEKVLTLSGETPNNDQALKQLKKEYETETFKVVAVKDISVTEKLYGMSELDFLKYATELDPVKRKALEA